MRFILWLPLLLLPSLVWAQQGNTYSANHILPACRLAAKPENQKFTLEEALDIGTCQGIVATLLAHGARFDQQFRFCAPLGANTGQAIAVIVQALDAQPQNWHLDFRALALVVLKHAWPCGQ